MRVAAPSGIQAKSGSLLLRRDDFSAHVCAQVACPTPAITIGARRILSPTYRANGPAGRAAAACNPLAIFRPAISVSRRKFGFFAVRYKKIAFSGRPCGGPYDASRVCGGARLSASLSYLPLVPPNVPFLSLSLSLSLALSASRRIFTPWQIKNTRIFLRGRYASRRSETGTRARCPFFSLLRAPLSRITEWIVIGYNRSRCRPPPPPPSEPPSLSPLIQ